MTPSLIFTLAIFALTFQPGQSVGPPPNPFAIYHVCEQEPCEFHNWDGVCITGTAQSPINLDTFEATSYRKLSTTHQNRLGHLYGTQNLKFATYGLCNTGHDAQITLPGQVQPIIRDPLTNKTYEFVQAHFHWGPGNNGSEHSIDGTLYSGELHLVHYKTDYGSFERAFEAEDDPESLLVVGILLNLSKRSNPALAPVVRTLRQIKYYDFDLPVHEHNDTIDLAALFPRNLDFFRYRGSLTVPTCNQQVLWLVHKHPIPISLTQIRQFQQVEDFRGVQIANNWRTVQPRNSRAIEFYNIQFRSNAFVSIG